MKKRSSRNRKVKSKTIPEQKEITSNVSDAALIVLFLTVLAYGMLYMYYGGLYSFYGIPMEFIDLDLTKIVHFGSRLLAFLAVCFFIGAIVRAIDTLPFTLPLFKVWMRKVVQYCILPLTIAGIVTFLNMDWIEKDANFTSILFFLYIFFMSIFLVYICHTFQEKILGARFVAITFFICLLGLFSGFLGYYTASDKDTYMIYFKENLSYIVLDGHKDNFLIAPILIEDASYNQSFQYIDKKTGDNQWFEAHYFEELKITETKIADLIKKSEKERKKEPLTEYYLKEKDKDDK